MRWTAEEDRKLTWEWERLGMRALVRLLDRSRVAIYDRARKLGLGSGTPCGAETIAVAARRCGVSERQMLRALDAAHVLLRDNRTLKRQRKGARKVRWILSEEADAAIALWVRSETITAGAERCGMSRYALDRMLRARGQVLVYGRVLRAEPHHIDAAAREWHAAGGQTRGPRSTRYGHAAAPATRATAIFPPRDPSDVACGEWTPERTAEPATSAAAVFAALDGEQRSELARRRGAS